MSALRYVYAPHFFFLSVLISLHDENRKTLESLLFILIFGLFRTATRTIEATFSRLTSTFHRKEKEMNVRDTRRKSMNLTKRNVSNILRLVNLIRDHNPQL